MREQPVVVVPRVSGFSMALSFALVPLVVVLGVLGVAISLRTGEGSANMTAVILVCGGLGFVFALVELLAILRRAGEALRPEELGGQEIGRFLQHAPADGSNLFIEGIRALHAQWGRGGRPHAVNSEPIVRLVHHQLSKGPKLLSALSGPLTVLGMVGTCLSINAFLGSSGTALSTAKVGGVDLAPSLAQALALLPEAMNSTIAGIVAGPLVLRGVGVVLQGAVNDLVARYEALLVTYIEPQLRGGPTP